ncbi:GT-D fold domain-containing glycosyltransferase [Brumimicrobium mesophilum]|uniref:GT-D fold domain-containing glycosyltransferase n=1 Tax=Brumimicrobium mesophilum TaxID=392717 RepID=UPI000D141720|nr:GT-D fold domain-containing glycosyltransferase [Brumimicrobium mesophilum]
MRVNLPKINRAFRIGILRLLNLSDERIYRSIHRLKKKHPEVLGIKETLNELIHTDKSISRFGDGEYSLCLGRGIGFQEVSKTLSNRMREILIKGSTENCIVSILNFPNDKLSDYSKMFWYENVVSICRLLDLGKTYFNSNITRSLSKEQFLLMKQIWDKRNVIFVSGKGSRLNEEHFLFDNMLTKHMVYSQPVNAWQAYNQTIEEVLEVSNKVENPIVICSLGPTASVLAYDLSKLNIRTLDLGHFTNSYDNLVLNFPKPENLPYSK